MKRFFAGESDAGTSTSHGFANDWTVYVFSNRQARDAFVSDRKNLSTVAIAKKDVTKHAANWSMTRNEYNKPRPFIGEFWGIVENYRGVEEIDGCIGVVEVCDADGHPAGFVDRLF